MEAGRWLPTRLIPIRRCSWTIVTIVIGTGERGLAAISRECETTFYLGTVYQLILRPLLNDL
jgi:hypothetical protein